MKHISIVEAGGPEVLQLVEGKMPRRPDGGVQVRVHAAGVNRPEVLQRRCAYPSPPDASEIPGLEVAGIVEGSPPVSPAPASAMRPAPWSPAVHCCRHRRARGTPLNGLGAP